MASVVLVLVCALLLACLATGSAIASDIGIDGVPLPGDAQAADGEGPFAGAWAGRYDGILKTILVVERAPDKEDGAAIYAIGANPMQGIDPAWRRLPAERQGDALVVKGRLSVTYRLSPTGRLRAVYGDGYAFGVLSRQPLDALAGGQVAWDDGEHVMLDVGLTEDGVPVPLEVVLFHPPGTGPFPLAVMNHGSTGAGVDETIRAHTWRHAWFADVLNTRGYLVAFVQRRGRGRSGGLYDEGFGPDRSKGYTCDPGLSLAGAERALTDIEAAVRALKARRDVSDAPILLAGNSRGGALSVAYAGLHPDDVSGVVNFVGGWIGTVCPEADRINGTVFGKGAAFSRPMLWLYGADDTFYANGTPARYHAAFEAAGGNAMLRLVTVRGENNGHFVMAVPPLWESAVTDYLDAVDRAR